jgi:hypothetical protein
MLLNSWLPCRFIILVTYFQAVRGGIVFEICVMLKSTSSIVDFWSAFYFSAVTKKPIKYAC